jgi:hypothetical protein
LSADSDEDLDVTAQHVMRGMWIKHLPEAKASLAEAERLRVEGFLGPAYVWAVRGVEMFVRNCLLLPAYYEELRDTVAATDRASKQLGAGEWDRALREVMRRYGPLDQALTDDDRNAWTHWRKVVGRDRGDIVHGRTDATREQVEWVFAYADRFMSWWAQRLAVQDRGPLRGVLRDLFELLPPVAGQDDNLGS